MVFAVSMYGIDLDIPYTLIVRSSYEEKCIQIKFSISGNFEQNARYKYSSEKRARTGNHLSSVASVRWKLTLTRVKAN